MRQLQPSMFIFDGERIVGHAKAKRGRLPALMFIHRPVSRTGKGNALMGDGASVRPFGAKSKPECTGIRSRICPGAGLLR